MKLNLTTLLAGIVVVLLLVIGYFMFVNKSFFTKSGPAVVSGEFNINGVIPTGATITLTQIQLGQKNAQEMTIARGIPAADHGAWSFPNAVSGTSYELQATVQANGKTIAQSSPLQVTAPADSETLVINIASDETTVQNAVISGDVTINGYIPQGATISVEGKLIGETDYTTIASGLPAKTKQFMSYTTAVAGKVYQVKGQMFDVNGTAIGSSDILELTAPALDETLTINSKAQPPVTPTAAANTPTVAPVATTLSGSINFNGAAPANSRIVIFQRVTGSQNFQVAVDNITPSDGTTWQWTKAKNATWYDLVAILKQRQNDGTDKDLAKSAVMTVAAPANNIQFTLNSGISLSAPSGNITVTCNSQSGNAWNTTVNFPAVSGAQSYWIQIGTSNGGTERMNQTQNASGNPLQAVNPSFQSGVTYYARYAYANVQNAPAGSNDFSAFSGTTSMICQ